MNNYKDEINDLIGIRVIHIFKDQWQEIHEFIVNTWKVIEITANVRDGDNIEVEYVDNNEKSESPIDVIEIVKEDEELTSENHTFGEICKNSDKIVLENLKKERFLEWGLINGKDLYLEVYKAPLIDRDGRVVGTIGTGRDITEWYLELKDAILSSSNCSTMCKNNVTSDILQQLDKYKFEG
jgi:hypothetical protein